MLGIKDLKINGMFEIESLFFLESLESQEHQEFFFSYYYQKLKLVLNLFPKLNAKMFDYTDHGEKHIKNISEIYSKILVNMLPGLKNSNAVIGSPTLSFLELYILLSATLWHDIGNLLGRLNHEEKAVEIVDRLKESSFPDANLKKIIFDIVKTHCGNKQKLLDLDTIKKYNLEEINIRFIASLLRFTDELDEGRKRIKPIFYDSFGDQLDPNSLIYWEVSNCIESILPNSNTKRIEVYICINSESKLYEKYNKEVNDKIIKVALIDEIIFRVDKLNNERILFMDLKRGDFFISFNELVLEIRIEEKNGKKSNEFLFSFKDNRGYCEFWKNCLDIYNPMKKDKQYKLQKGC